jgi:branched-chain amino acid transport system substrate-binding protein
MRQNRHRPLGLNSAATPPETGKQRLFLQREYVDAANKNARHGAAARCHLERRNRMILWKLRSASLRLLCLAVLALGGAAASPALAASPIKIGFSVGLTGPTAPGGNEMLTAMRIWQADVNAHGGLLGRPVKFVYYDDQSNPANVPNIVAKLLDVDHVDLLIGLGTYAVAAAMPLVISHDKIMVAELALAVNDHFHYPRYFQTMPYGPHGKKEITRGFFEIASSLKPKPKTVALLAEDNEFGATAIQGASENAKEFGFQIVYDGRFPPGAVDLTSVMRAIAAKKPDLVVTSSYPDGTNAILPAASEMRLHTEMFGGAMVGTQFTHVKQHFADMLNGLINYETYSPEPTMRFPGVVNFLQTYREKAAKNPKIDPLGFYVAPMAFTTMQVIQQAIEGVKTLDQGKLAAYMHRATFHTILGNFRFGQDGEWSEPQMLMCQFQRVHGNGLAQFAHAGTEVILSPGRLRSGKLLHPYPLGH